MTTVICAYQLGRGFRSEHVDRLRDQIAIHAQENPFVCVKMSREWRDYWCKIEAFRVRGPCLYLDLDVTIVGDLTPLLEAAKVHEFIALNRFEGEGINTSVMAWRGDVSRLYRHADVATLTRYVKAGQTDEWYVAEAWGRPITRWQEILPGMAISYKKEWLQGADRRDCRICYFHGKPRPWEVEEVSLAA